MLGENSYAFTICSVHMIDGISISDKKNYMKFNDFHYFEKILEGYYREIISSLRVKEFDVIGHIGIFERYLKKEYLLSHPLKSRIIEIFDDIAKKCAQSDKMIEVNTSGLFSTIESTIPDSNFLTAYYNYGGRTISIGSDAHAKEHAGRGIKEAISMVKEIGFKYIMLPWNKEKPIYV